jgi:type II secretion system protein J
MSRPRAGFTLLEVMVAIAILGTIVGLIYGSFASTAASKQKIEEGNEIYHEARWAMNKMEDDLASAFVSRSKNTVSIFLGPSGTGRGEYPIDEMHFTSFNHVKYEPTARESDQAEISYFVSDNPDTGFPTLYRREDATPDADNTSGGEYYELCDKVLGFDLAYYDGTEWQEEWDSRDWAELDESESTIENQSDDMINTLPMAVEVRLLVEGPLDPNGVPTQIAFHSKIRLVLSTIDMSLMNEDDDEDGGGDDDNAGGSGTSGAATGSATGASN